MGRSTDHSAQENSPPPNPLVYEDSFNRTLQNALLNLGKTGEHYLASFGEERPRAPVSPPRMVTYQRHPSYQNGKQDEERRSPMTEEEEAMESQQEMENAITYSSSSINTNNHINSDVSTDDKDDEEALPQDLSMISNRNVDS